MGGAAGAGRVPRLAARLSGCRVRRAWAESRASRTPWALTGTFAVWRLVRVVHRAYRGKENVFDGEKV